MNKLKYETVQDEFTDSPREWDNLGYMVCSHREYNLGDEQFDAQKFNSWKEVKADLESRYDIAVILPLYLYDHSGISMYTDGDTGYRQHQAWDSGQVGFIFVTKEDLQNEYDGAEDAIERATEVLKGEIATYSQYLSGDVYQVTATDEDGEIVESLGGLYGQEDVDDFIKEVEDNYVAPRDSSRAKTAQQLHAN